MRFMLLDEAGISKREPWLVIAVVIIEADKQLFEANRMIREVVRDYFPKDKDYLNHLHATEIYSGSRSISRNSWSFEDRISALSALASIPYALDLPIAVSLSKSDPETQGRGKILKLTDKQFDHVMAYGNCLERADLYLRDYLNSKEVGCVYAEDVHTIREQLSLMQKIAQMQGERQKGEGQENIKYYRTAYSLPFAQCIVHPPCFVKKNEILSLCLPDICAFIFRAWASKSRFGDELLTAMLGPTRSRAINQSDSKWRSSGTDSLIRHDAFLVADQIENYHWKNNKSVLNKLVRPPFGRADPVAG